ncbi:MAG: hypothetical protein GXY48_02415 [Methanomicrobiales archaeon]|nr:hypothetical protein [Methanomicrobiales archaeon]
MNGFTIPSLKVTMIWLFGIMVICFAIGGVLIILESDNHEKNLEKQERIHIPSSGIEKAQVNLEIDSGTVNLTSGPGPDLIQGQVIVNGVLPSPRLSHTITNRTGNIVIERSKNFMQDIIGGEENWDIELQNKTPTSLLVSLGTGELNITSGKMNLSELGIENGAGSLSLDLHEWEGKRLQVKIVNGVGEMTLLFPEKSDISVFLERGIGNSIVSGFTANNQGYSHESVSPGNSEIIVHISQGLGDLTLKTVP